MPISTSHGKEEAAEEELKSEGCAEVPFPSGAGGGPGGRERGGLGVGGGGGGGDGGGLGVREVVGWDNACMEMEVWSSGGGIVGGELGVGGA